MCRLEQGTEGVYITLNTGSPIYHFSTGAQDPIAALFSEKLSQYRKLAAAEGDMVGVSDADVAKQQDQLERLKKMYAVQGDVLSFPDAKF